MAKAVKKIGGLAAAAVVPGGFILAAVLAAYIIWRDRRRAGPIY